MNTPETRAMVGLSKSPWRLKAILLLDSMQPDWPESHTIQLLCDWLADAYNQGRTDCRAELEQQRGES